MSSNTRLPTFLYIGPDKSGSTWIHELLVRHPQVYVPNTKDMWFFDRYYDRGLDWYRGFFSAARPDQLAIGELSHNYLFSCEAATRIREELPDVKLVVSLRDPVERLFSHYLFMIRSGRTKASLEEALDAFPELIDHSSYGRHLQRYLSMFPREQLLVLWFDELQRHPREYGRKLCVGLGVDYLPDFPYERVVQKASRPRSHLVAAFARIAANSFRALRLERVVGRVKRSFVMRLIYKEFENSERPRLSPDQRAEIQKRLRADQSLLREELQLAILPWDDDGQAND